MNYLIEINTILEIGLPQKDEKIAYKKVMDEKAKNLACPNEKCEKYGKIGEKNIVFRNKYVRPFQSEKEHHFLDFIYLKKKFFSLLSASLKEMVRERLREFVEFIGIP